MVDPGFLARKHLSEFTVPQLKTLADQHGVQYASKILKADLIRLLEDKVYPEGTPVPSPSLQSKTVKDLKDLLNKQNIPYSSSDTKKDLIDRLEGKIKTIKGSPLEKLTKKELEQRAIAQGLTVRSNFTKADLIDLIEGKRESPVVKKTKVTPQRKKTNSPWEKETVADIRKKVLQHKLGPVTGKTKTQLISLLDQSGLTPDIQLHKFTIAELRKIASDNDIELTSKMTKAQIIKELEKHMG